MSDGATSSPLARQTCLIGNRLGLHARAAAKFVKLAGTFDAEVWVERNGARVSGVSILGLMMLAAGPGTELTLESAGPNAVDALNALAQLIENKFDED
ncbi:MAG: HPr family phosphocarrier protein [Alphaproteobacteria bacterium]